MQIPWSGVRRFDLMGSRGGSESGADDETNVRRAGTLVLVDLNNVDPTAGNNEVLLRDVLERIDDLTRRALIPRRLPSLPRDAYDVEVRLYDGWIDKTGTTLERYAVCARILLDTLAGLQAGVRIQVTQVTALACAPNATLAGTYIRGGQKMVDQMLAQDLRHFVDLGEHERICLIADDDDYTPPVLAAASVGSVPITWLRARDEGRNDRHLQLRDLVLLADDGWRRR